MSYYKVLDEKGRAFHGGTGRWPLPKNGQPGAWKELKGKRPLAACVYGLHGCRDEQILQWLGPTIWELEYEKEPQTAGNKVFGRKARLLRRLNWDERIARLFACDCAERALCQERKAGREPDKRCWEAVAVARRYIDGRANKDDLEAAWEAAREAAREAAWEAAGEAAWKAARGAAGAAARETERKWQYRRLRDYLYGKRATGK